ncbi:hypothetical protein IU451_28800 [Nocardia cyriacigeorgica]|uniref:hypothetical protein n=1 Tax=Nocardia cyriacigeorgica TaxID=135487 RepID=UPI0018950A71|nr:hypothetical protein [Nocardia cyriacigeorgica]MBF6326502.1 hypothetical protein [Nocardia cyriacigeorgica]
MSHRLPVYSRVDYTRITLSECGSYRTHDGTPYGNITEVRCPERVHCLGLVPVVGRKLEEHAHNDLAGTPCEWSGAKVIDDRDSLEGREYLNRAGMTAILPPDAKTRGRTFHTNT